MDGLRFFRGMRQDAGSLLAVLGLALLVGGCRPDDQRTETLDPRGASTRAQLAPEVVEALDSGTVAFREHRFEDALEHYGEATELAPEEAAGWFGLVMAYRALGDLESAEEALEKVRDLAPGATILHPGEDTLPGTAGS